MHDADITEELTSRLLRRVASTAEPPPVEDTLRRLREDLARRDLLACFIRKVWRRLPHTTRPATVRARLLPIEIEILAIANDLSRYGANEPASGWFYAYRMAELIGQSRGKPVTNHGTLHRVLSEMHDKGWIERAPIDVTVERPTIARRPYRITPNGRWALERAALAVRDGVRSYRGRTLILEAPSPWGWDS